MAGAKIALGNTSGELKTDAYDNAKVNTPLTESEAGFAMAASEIDAGTVMGSRTTKAFEVSDDFRLRIGQDAPLFSHSFEGTIVARDRIQQNDSTMTAAQTGGFLVINSANATASANVCSIRTYRTFPLFATYIVHGDFWLREANYDATGSSSEWGFGYVSGGSTPTDGVFFRRMAGGALRAILNFGGVETEATIDTASVPARDGAGLYSPSEVNHFLIYIHNDDATFWINNTMVARIDLPAGQGGPSSSSTLPLFARVGNSGVSSAGRRLEIGFLGVSQGDIGSIKPMGHAASGWGAGAYQIQPGTTSGPNVTRGASTTAGWPNSAQARGAGTWTATSAPAVNSLGGQWVSPAISTLTSEADYPVFAYLNPAGSATLAGRTLYITGVRWGNTVATAAAATNPINLNYIIGIGSTGAGTAVAEAAAAIAARGMVVDTIPFKSTAAIGDYVPGGNVDFSQSPLVIPPGCYLHWIVRPYGTVTSNTLTVNGTVNFIGYYE